MQVKDYDIGFSVCLRERVYVLQGDGSGGSVENEVIPFFKLSVRITVDYCNIFLQLCPQIMKPQTVINGMICHLLCACRR